RARPRGRARVHSSHGGTLVQRSPDGRSDLRQPHGVRRNCRANGEFLPGAPRHTHRPDDRAEERMMDALLQDLREALRRMRRAPVLATAIVLTIGLGLGAAAAIFATSKAALVEPLPYAEPQRLVHLWEL